MEDGLKRKITIIGLSILITISCIFIGLYVYDNIHIENKKIIETQTPLVVDDGVDINESQEVKEDFTEIPVYTSFTVTKKTPNIYLGNPEINNVYFRYKVYLKPNEELDENEEIDESLILFNSDSVIKPGRAFEINLYELLESGEYQVIIDISTFSIEDETQCNGAAQEVKVIVKE